MIDPLFEAGTGAPIINDTQLPQPVTEIGWSAEDALSAPLCLSSTFLNSSGATETITNAGTVLGNVVLTDQELPMPPVALPTVPEPWLFVPPSAANSCVPPALVVPVFRFAIVPVKTLHEPCVPLAGSPGPLPCRLVCRHLPVGLADSKKIAS